MNMWDERYSEAAYAYGKEPNQYFKEQLNKLPHGKILLPAEGEGRNAVYAAKKLWNVTAFDLSIEGKKKAFQLAELNEVTINYQVGSLDSLNYETEEFDVIALIYAHFPIDIRSTYHQKLSSYLRKGGILIFEAFSKNNLAYVEKNPKIGGPKNLDMLFSVEEIKLEFHNFEFKEIEEKEIQLEEGLYHNGNGSVIRFVGVKK